MMEPAVAGQLCNMLPGAGRRGHDAAGDEGMDAVWRRDIRDQVAARSEMLQGISPLRVQPRNHRIAIALVHGEM